MKKNYKSGLVRLKRVCSALMLAGALITGGQLKAQVSNMNFQTLSGGYTAINGGTVIGTPTDDDATYGNQAIGFNFTYNGTVYTQFGLNTNGWISMGPGVPTNSYTPLSTGTTNNVIAGFARDLQLGYWTTGNTTVGSTTLTGVGSISGVTVGSTITGTGIPVGATVTAAAGTTITISAAATSTNTGVTFQMANGETRVQTIGTAPNRVCVIQWSRVKPYNTPNNNFNFQIRLSETTNQIDVVYGVMFTLANQMTVEVGLRGSSNADFNNRTTANNWSLTTAGGANNVTCTLSPFVYPGIGTDFNWLQAPNDLSIVGISAPVAGTTCLHSETISVTVKNTGTQTLNFANNPAYVFVSSTGLNPQNFPAYTLLNGTLAPGATQSLIVASNFNMAPPGTYTFTGSLSMIGDGFAPNNTMPLATYTSNTPSVNAGNNVTICQGASTNLSATATANGNITISNQANVNVPLPDNTTVTTTMSIANAIGNANQIISITINTFTHTWMSDVTMRIFAPNNSSATLIQNRGGSGDNMTNTVFFDAAGTAIAAGTAPFTGNFRPETPFSALTGSANGTWTLQMNDNASGDVGLLTQWTITYMGTNGIASYTWSPAAGLNNPNIANPVASPIVTTNYVVTTLDLAGCTNTDTVRVTVNPLPGVPAPISGPATVCEGQANVMYVASSSNALTYSWTVPAGASIVGNANNDTIYVTFGLGAVSGNITVSGVNACGSSPNNATLAVTVDPLPVNAGAITGNSTVCEGVTGVMYMVPSVANATGYNWTVPAGAMIAGGQNTNMIMVDFPVGSVSGNVTVNGTNACGNGGSSSFPVTVNPLPANPGMISGPDSVCANSMGVMYSVGAIANTTTYMWTVPTGANIVGNANNDTIWVDFPFGAASGNVTVMGNNSCGNSPMSSMVMVTVVDTTGAIGAITGSATACEGATSVSYMVSPVANASWYNWTLPAGATIVAGANTNSILVDFAVPTSGNITVYGYNTCDTSMTATLAITAVQNLGNTSPITGPATVCQGQAGVVYTVPAVTNATAYTWTVPSGATIVGGANTNTITVDFSNAAMSGTVDVFASNSCFNGPLVTYAVTVDPLPVASFQYAFNGATAGFVNTSSNGTSYSWDFGDGYGDTLNSPVHTYTSNGNYTVKLVATNACGSDSVTVVLNVTKVGIEVVGSTSEVNVYPNPTKNIIQVQLSGATSGQLEVRILDIAGKVVYDEQVNGFNGQYKKAIDISNQSKGVYSLQFITNHEVITRKVVLD